MSEVNGDQFNAKLSADDAMAIDHLLEQLSEGKQNIDDLADSATDERHRKAAELLQLIDQCPADAPKLDLTQRTMARITQEQQKKRFATQIEALRSGGSSSGFRMSDLITVAAVILIGVGLFTMMLPRVREDSRRVACANQLNTAGTAFGQYAMDHQGQLPRSENVQPGGFWYRVGYGPSNTAHLYRLVSQDYLDVEDLACPDNPHASTEHAADVKDWPSAAAVSYSYANQFTPRPRTLSASPRLVLLADKNPLFVIKGKKLIVVRSNSPVIPNGMFHNRKGQNMLSADGSVRWAVEPVVVREDGTKDNIWMIGNLQQYVGNEVPTDANDNFLVP